jgi:hypothetical protein
VNSRAREAEKYAQFGRRLWSRIVNNRLPVSSASSSAYPLWARRSTIYAFVVAIRLCYGLEFTASFRVHFPHLVSTHLCDAGMSPVKMTCRLVRTIEIEDANVSCGRNGSHTRNRSVVVSVVGGACMDCDSAVRRRSGHFRGDCTPKDLASTLGLDHNRRTATIFIMDNPHHDLVCRCSRSSMLHI